MNSTSTYDRVAATNSRPVASKATKAVATATSDETVEWTDAKASSQALRAAQARQVSGRRRFVDPTTCEREYTVAEMEFMQAMQDYKARSGRMFPTWSEVLEVADECRRVNADLLITIGGGSLTDAAKLVALVCDRGPFNYLPMGS